MKLLVAVLACVAAGAVVWALQERKDKNKLLQAFLENVTVPYDKNNRGNLR